MSLKANILLTFQTADMDFPIRVGKNHLDLAAPDDDKYVHRRIKETSGDLEFIDDISDIGSWEQVGYILVINKSEDSDVAIMDDNLQPSSHAILSPGDIACYPLGGLSGDLMFKAAHAGTELNVEYILFAEDA